MNKELIELDRNNKGFSLVELIIVIAIMAVLVGVIAPMFLMYVESSREAIDIQNMDSAFQLASAVYAEDPYAVGTYYYFFDGNEIRNDSTPSAYGKGRVMDRRKRYNNPCCSLGEYDGSQDYTGRYIVVVFPDPDSSEQRVHVHWSN